MPEISEVARIVHYLRKHLVNRTIASVQAQDDPIVYGKVGCSADALRTALTGKKVIDARQQGKYFWLVMDSPPHPLMHFGMTGWLKFRDDESGHYRPQKDKKDEGVEVHAAKDEEWPPRFWKFNLQAEGQPRVEAAFVDARRLGRVRLVDVPAEQMRTSSPLKENGPDPVIDSDVLTEEWLVKKMRSKRVPVKAFLLDQANISGVGNWVGDEVLYNAKIHPEQYSNSLTDAQLKQLHKSLYYVCKTSCDLLGDSEQFPKDWLMLHRWNKGKNSSSTLPNGAKIVHITVGGRTSAVVPSVQKKTGPVAGDVDSDTAAGTDEKPVKGKSKAKGQVNGSKVEDESEDEAPKSTQKKTGTKRKSDAKDESKAKKAKPDSNTKATPKVMDAEPSNRRRSTRNRGN